MRPKLIQSFIVVVLFWLGVTTLWWSLQSPDVNLKALLALKELIPALPITVPEEAAILGSLAVQRDVLLWWSLPVLIGTFLSGCLGYGLMWLKARGTATERTHREAGHGEYRGARLTVGELPVPLTFPRHEITLAADGSDDSLAKLTGKELRLLGDILGTLSAHPQAYAGHGISDSLLDHALKLATKALESPRNAGLAALVAAGHEMGKITAFEQGKDGSWAEAKNQDNEAARILRTLESWFALPELERNAVMLAVKYHSNPRYLPEVDSDPQILRLAKDLLFKTEDNRVAVVKEAKEETLEAARLDPSKPLSEQVFDAFLQALPSLPFQSRGLPKGVAAVAWKVGSRAYLLEIKLRDTVMSRLPADLRGALQPNPKERTRLQPFTLELLKALHQKGWLVTQIADMKLLPKEAVWNVRAGKLDFRGVLAVDVPPEFMSQLPNDDSMYEIAVTGPLFTSTATSMGVTKDDLLGSVLRPPAAPRA